jgi:hypothetical protein
MAETTVKRLLCCGLVEDMSRNKCFFQVRIHMFYVLYSYVTCLLTNPRTYKWYQRDEHGACLTTCSISSRTSGCRVRLTITFCLPVRSVM